MPANAVVGLDVELKVQKALDELKRIGPVSDAQGKAIAKQIGGALRDAEKSAKKLGDTASQAGGKALKAFGPLGGILGKVSPELGSLSSTIAAATSALEGFDAAGITLGGVVGPLAVGVGALAAAYLALTGPLERTLELQAITQAGYAAELPLLAKLATAKLDIAHQTGKITDAEYARAKVSADVAAQVTAATKADVDGITAASDAQGTLTTRFWDSVDAINVFAKIANSVLGTTVHWGTTTADLQAKIDAHAKSIKAATTAGEALEKTENKLANVTPKHAAKVVDLTAELLKQAHAAQAAADAFAAKLAGLEKEESEGMALVAASGAFRLSEVDKLAAAESAALDAYSAKYGATEAGRAAIHANYEEQISQTTADEADARIKILDDEAAKAKAIADEARAQRINDEQAVGSALISLGHDLVSATTQNYDTTTAAGRQAAQQQFNTQKAANLAMAVIAGALAVQQSLASSGPPANYIMAAITGAAAAVEIGVIAAEQPKFHAGGTMAPDEVQVGGSRMLAGEGLGVVSKQGMSSANAGMGSQPSTVQVDFKLRHSSLDTAMAQVNQRGGRFSSTLSTTRTAPFGARTDTWRR